MCFGKELSLRPLLTSASLALLLAGPAPALAKVVTVSSLSDDGPGTLRRAILNADPGDEIVVPQGTITLTSGQLVISKQLTIRGAGRDLTIVDGSAKSRSFFVTSAASGVAISGLRLRNGDAGLDDGGGVKNDGSLSLRDVAIAGNQAVNGGGIFSSGTLVASDAFLTGNHGSIGGGIASLGTTTLTRCTISGNDADHFGGGAEIGAGAMTISRCSILGNLSRSGGGIDINTGRAVVEDTVIDNNTASDTGGGGIMNFGRLILIGSKVTGNRVPVPTRVGGGLLNQGVAFVSGHRLRRQRGLGRRRYRERHGRAADHCEQHDQPQRRRRHGRRHPQCRRPRRHQRDLQPQHGGVRRGHQERRLRGNDTRQRHRRRHSDRSGRRPRQLRRAPVHTEHRRRWQPVGRQLHRLHPIRRSQP